MSDRNAKSVTDGGLLTVSFRSLALWSVIIALASLTGLVLVTALRQVDVLSVVALTLAIIAFVVQIILFIVQQSSAAQQAERLADLYTATASALAEIGEKTQGTKEAVSQMNNRVFDLFRSKAEREFAETPTPATASDVARVLDRRVKAATPVSRPSPPQTSNRPSFLDSDVPPDRIDEVLDAVRPYEGIELTTIRRMGQDQSLAERNGSPELAGLRSINSPQELYKKRLVRRRRVDWDESPIFQLTDLGQDVARLLLNPKYADDEKVKPLLGVLKRWDRDLENTISRVGRASEAIPVDAD